MSNARKQADHSPRTIQQTIEFRDATPEILYAMYVNPSRHAAAIRAPVSISDRVGEAFWVFSDGGVRGRNLAIIPERLIVQFWRAANWHQDDADSVLTLIFGAAGHGATIYLVQTNVPAHACDTIERGWATHYWEPWRTYLKALDT